MTSHMAVTWSHSNSVSESKKQRMSALARKNSLEKGLYSNRGAVVLTYYKKGGRGQDLFSIESEPESIN